MADTSVILVVEDREDDILLIRKAFEKASVPNPVHFVRGGEEAVAYLGGEGKYLNRAEYPLPALVLLDLKMPGMDGFEVLTWIRQQDGIRGLPVVVLTSSSEMVDVNRAYKLGANSFFVKEIDFQGTVNLSSLLQKYWLTKARTPQNSRQGRKAASNAHSSIEIATDRFNCSLPGALSRMDRLIAVVDDDPDMRDALARLLRAAGFDADTFPSGLKFLQSLHTRVPDLLILDLHMPDLDGLAVEERIIQDGIRLPLIILTGHDSDVTRQHALSAGACAYLHKPVGAHTLLGAINAALDKVPH